MSDHKKCSAVKLIIVGGKPTVVRCAIEKPKGQPWHEGSHSALGHVWEA